MAELKTLVDHASTQSDRWLFIALLVIGLITVWLLARYFIGEVRTTKSEHNELNNFVRDKLATTLERNTDALNRSTRMIERLSGNPDEVTERTHPHLRP